jgi:hypothetical protein
VTTVAEQIDDYLRDINVYHVVIDEAELIVVGKKSPEFANMVAGLGRDKIVVDLVRILSDPETCHGTYEGICW